MRCLRGPDHPRRGFLIESLQNPHRFIAIGAHCCSEDEADDHDVPPGPAAVGRLRDAGVIPRA